MRYINSLARASRTPVLPKGLTRRRLRLPSLVWKVVAAFARRRLTSGRRCMALRALARGGVFVAGGIAPKILPKMKDGTFLKAFCEKEKFAELMAQIPIRVVLNEEAPLL